MALTTIDTRTLVERIAQIARIDVERIASVEVSQFGDRRLWVNVTGTLTDVEAAALAVEAMRNQETKRVENTKYDAVIVYHDGEPFTRRRPCNWCRKWSRRGTREKPCGDATCGAVTDPEPGGRDMPPINRDTGDSIVFRPKADAADAVEVFGSLERLEFTWHTISSTSMRHATRQGTYQDCQKTWWERGNGAVFVQRIDENTGAVVLTNGFRPIGNTTFPELLLGFWQVVA